MLRAVFLLTSIVAATARAVRDEGETKLTHTVHLCSEEHRDAVGAEWPGAHHIRNLPSVRAIIVDVTKEEVASLNRDSRVCAVNAAQPVSHHPSAPSRRQLNSVSWGNFVGADKHALKGKANPWYEDSHHEGKPWNLDRINGKLDGDDDTENNGKGVNIFVLDTGLDTTHPEFKGDSREVENVGRFDGQGENWKQKKAWGWDDKPTDKASNDFDGHGTHCAATAAGKDYGIAPKANVYAMQVLGPDGTGSTEGILKAMDAVAEVVKKGKVKGPTVISMSLGGPCWESTQECAFDSDYARAIKDLRDDLGVITVVAAGNSNADACEFTPAASRAAITVAAMERGDKLSWFSNRGPCIDIIAPGSAIASARSGEEDDYISHVDDATEEYAVLDGTSQACPLVAGTLALYLQVLNDTEDAVAAMYNKAERVDALYSDDPSTCASNDWLVRTPGTSKKSKLDTTRGLELPCPIQGEDGYVPTDDDDGYGNGGYWDDWSWWDGACEDDTSAEDSYGDGCEYYWHWPDHCGDYDDDDFTANEMCCACINGEDSSTCTDTATTEDSYGDTCQYYDNYPDNCGSGDTADFVAREHCCACGGGDDIETRRRHLRGSA